MKTSGRVTKGTRGWEYETVAEYPDSPMRFRSCGGKRTYYWALYEALAERIETPKGVMTLEDAAAFLKTKITPWLVDVRVRRAKWDGKSELV